MKIKEMTKEEIYEHYNWTLEHEEKLKKSYFYLVNKYGINNPILEEKDIKLHNTIFEQMRKIIQMRKILLSMM